MKFEDLSFEEKLMLRINNEVIQPTAKESRIILDNLKWVLEVYKRDVDFKNVITLKAEYIETLPITIETVVIKDILRWVLETYSEDRNYGTKKVK